MADRAKHVLLTGASSGIGRAIAQALTGEGHEVWGSSRSLERLPQSVHFHPFALDLSEPSSISNSFSAALRDAGRFDVAINNAGSGHFGPAENLSQELITRQFQLLVFSHIQLMQLALASMRTQGHGLIINVTSLASRLPVPFMAAYNAAKAAMASFTMSIQLELAHSNVRVIDLQPGDIRTNFNDVVVRTNEHPLDYDRRIAKAWDVIDRNMKNAPDPDLVARRVCKLIASNDPAPRVTTADFFQGTIAPLIFNCLPQRVRIWGLKKYYRI